MRFLSAVAGLACACLAATSAIACKPDALGTSRVMKVDTSKFRDIEGYEKSFGLKHKEVILTFDDGPIVGKTPRVLKALKNECVKATFFYVGHMARAYPKLVRRVLSEGHTLGHHTNSHNRLPNYSAASAAKQIDRGIRTLQKIAYSKNTATPIVPFFRYPYLARNSTTDKLLADRGLIALSANIDSLDWKIRNPSKIHDRIMRVLKRQGKGIILMHDIQNGTAKMLPRLLRSLKKGGYRVVHIVPKPIPGGRPIPSRDIDPVVVASLTKPEKTQVRSASQRDREIARLADEAERDVQRSLLKAGVEIKIRKTAKPVAPVSKDDRKKTKSTEVIVAADGSIKTPQSVALAQERQLNRRQVSNSARKSDPIHTAALKPASKPRRKPALETVAGDAMTKRVSKRKTLPKRAKRKTNRKARRTRLANNIVKRGNWKLRRSQWIIN